MVLPSIIHCAERGVQIQRCWVKIEITDLVEYQSFYPNLVTVFMSAFKRILLGLAAEKRTKTPSTKWTLIVALYTDEPETIQNYGHENG